jgi:hypothetical protein
MIRRYARKAKRAGDRVADAVGFIIKIGLGVFLGFLLSIIAAPYLAG